VGKIRKHLTKRDFFKWQRRVQLVSYPLSGKKAGNRYCQKGWGEQARIFRKSIEKRKKKNRRAAADEFEFGKLREKWKTSSDRRNMHYRLLIKEIPEGSEKGLALRRKAYILEEK